MMLSNTSIYISPISETGTVDFKSWRNDQIKRERSKLSSVHRRSQRTEKARTENEVNHYILRVLLLHILKRNFSRGRRRLKLLPSDKIEGTANHKKRIVAWSGRTKKASRVDHGRAKTKTSTPGKANLFFGSSSNADD